MSFDLVAPLILELGFCPVLARSDIGPVIVARAFKQLMGDVLGYKTSVTQGGDFDAFITRYIAIQFPPSVRAMHSNMFSAPAPALTTSPRAYLRWCFLSYLYFTF